MLLNRQAKINPQSLSSVQNQIDFILGFIPNIIRDKVLRQHSALGFKVWCKLWCYGKIKWPTVFVNATYSRSYLLYISINQSVNQWFCSHVGIWCHYVCHDVQLLLSSEEQLWLSSLGHKIVSRRWARVHGWLQGPETPLICFLTVTDFRRRQSSLPCCCCLYLEQSATTCHVCCHIIVELLLRVQSPFGQWAAANCAALPTASAGQYATAVRVSL